MAQSARRTRRPMFGVLLFLVSLLVLTSILSSPPWSGGGPLFGLPADACGEVGRVASAFLLDGVGLPLLGWLLAAGLLFGSSALFLHPASPGRTLAWALLPALGFSILGAALWGGALFGQLATGLIDALRSPGFLGPIGAALLAIAFFVGALVLLCRGSCRPR
ncbi:MAG: hypothetical protein U0527_15860 [Candidatus Eisenbacteria bacterium]